MKITDLEKQKKYRLPYWVDDTYIRFDSDGCLTCYKGEKEKRSTADGDWQLEHDDVISSEWYEIPDEGVLLKESIHIVKSLLINKDFATMKKAKDFLKEFNI